MKRKRPSFTFGVQSESRRNSISFVFVNLYQCTFRVYLFHLSNIIMFFFWFCFSFYSQWFSVYFLFILISFYAHCCHTLPLNERVILHSYDVIFNDNMAEAAIERQSETSKFYCHSCSEEINPKPVCTVFIYTRFNLSVYGYHIV